MCWQHFYELKKLIFYQNLYQFVWRGATLSLSKPWGRDSVLPFPSNLCNSLIHLFLIAFGGCSLHLCIFVSVDFFALPVKNVLCVHCAILCCYVKHLWLVLFHLFNFVNSVWISALNPIDHTFSQSVSPGYFYPHYILVDPAFSLYLRSNLCTFGPIQSFSLLHLRWFKLNTVKSFYFMGMKFHCLMMMDIFMDTSIRVFLN